MVKMKKIISASKKGVSSYQLSEEKSGMPDVPVINMRAVQDGYIDPKNVDLVKIDQKFIRDVTKIKSGDLIITCRGTTLKAAVADEFVNDFVLSNNLMAFTLSTEVKPEIIAAYLNGPVGQRELNKMAGGTNMLTLNLKGLEQVLVPLIPASEQDKIVQFIKEAKEYKACLVKELELWEELVDSYLVDKWGDMQ
jgi:restriction endonuclease S subunit